MRPSCDWRLAQWSKTEREWTSGRKWNAQNGAVMGACCYSGWCDECWPDGVNGENWPITTDLQRARAVLEGRRPWAWASLPGIQGRENAFERYCLDDSGREFFSIGARVVPYWLTSVDKVAEDAAIAQAKTLWAEIADWVFHDA